MHFGCGCAALRRIADLQSATRQRIQRAGIIERLAGYNPAIRQIENLRYLQNGNIVEERRTLKSVAIKFGLVTASVLFVLALTEGACRLYTLFVPPIPTSHFYFRASRPPPYQDAPYFSKAFVRESFSQPGGWRTDPSFGWIPNDYQGKDFNVRHGRRVTTDLPPNAQVKQRILLFGGSTLYCSEVPDSLTIASFLQRMLNADGKATCKVENVGATTITIRQQLARLRMEQVSPGDLVVFYDGVNDVLQSIFYNNPEGSIIDESRRQLESLRPVERFLFKIHRRLAPYSAFVSVFLNPIKGSAQAKPSFDSAVVERAADHYAQTIVEAAEYCQTRQAKFLHLLQPNLFVAPKATPYEKSLLENPWLISRGLAEAFAVGYPKLREACDKAKSKGVKTADISNCLDQRTGEVFLDAWHVNQRANEMIARAIFKQLRGEIQ